MSVSVSLYSAEEIARLGDALYEAEIQPNLPVAAHGQVVALDVTSHAYVVADNAVIASQQLLARYPEAEIWCVRVGERSLHRIGIGSRQEGA